MHTHETTITLTQIEGDFDNLELRVAVLNDAHRYKIVGVQLQERIRYLRGNDLSNTLLKEYENLYRVWKYINEVVYKNDIPIEKIEHQNNYFIFINEAA